MRLQWRHRVWMGLDLERPFHALALKILGERHGVAVSKDFCSSLQALGHLERDLLNSNYRRADVTYHRVLWCIALARPLEVSSLESA